MSELNKENQVWFKANQEDPADFFCGVMDSDVVRKKLLEMQREIETAQALIAELEQAQEWISVENESDIPKVDSVVVYTESKPHNLDNLFCSVGYLSWSSDFSYGSVIDDGEIVSLSHIRKIYLIGSPLPTQPKG